MSILGGDRQRIARRRPGLAAAALVLLLCAVPVPGGTAPGIPAGDRLLARERAARLESLRTLVGQLTDFDDALIAAGRDNPARHRRINRLIALDASGIAAGFEPTAALAGLLDDLLRDPDVAGSRLAPEVLRARTFALQRLVAAIPGTRLPVSEDLPAMQRLFEERGEDGGDSLGAPRPLLPERPQSPAARLLEEGVTGSVPVPGSGSGVFRYLPGSRYVLSGDGRDIYVVDLEKNGAAERIAAADAEPAPAVSASGEYVALVTTSRSARDVRLIRRMSNTPPRTIITGKLVDALHFDPRDLNLAVLVDGNLELVDAAGGNARRIAEQVGPGALLAWSPDGVHLALSTPAVTDDGIRTVVFDAATGARVFDDLFPGRAPAWYADNRSLTSLAFSPSADGMAVVIERRIVDGGEPDRLPLFDLATGTTITGPSWSPDGRRAAFRIDTPAGRPIASGSPSPGIAAAVVADGFPGSAFFSATSAVRIVHFPIPDSARYDPPAAALPGFSWHPSGRWYAARQEFGAGGGLFLHDTVTGDAIPLGDLSATRPAFSPDGKRVLWIERTPSGERFAYRDMNPVHENVSRSRAFGAQGARALIAGHHGEAALAFRNAWRLAPGEPRTLQGLGRAYIGAAFDGRFAAWKASLIEAAVLAFGRAVDEDRASPDILVDFLDASGRLAWIQGKVESERFIDSAQNRLASPPPPGDSARRRYAAGIRDALVEAIFWDPENEYPKILLDGILARFPKGGP